MTQLHQKMKKKQKEELRSKSIAELNKEVDNREREILNLKIEIKTGKNKNTSSVKRKLDELAIVKTILAENVQRGV